jgi:ATP-dependent DNA ligase
LKLSKTVVLDEKGPEKVVKLILDTELCVWDKTKNIEFPYGTAMQNIEDYKERKLFIFDILHINDTTLVKRPLEERLKILQALKRESMARECSPVKICEHEIIDTSQLPTEDLAQKIHEDLQTRDIEGIVIKRAEDKYTDLKPWLKVKAARGRIPDWDLCIVGAKQSSNPDRKWSSVFLAARDENEKLFVVCCAKVTDEVERVLLPLLDIGATRP